MSEYPGGGPLTDSLISTAVGEVAGEGAADTLRKMMIEALNERTRKAVYEFLTKETAHGLSAAAVDAYRKRVR